MCVRRNRSCSASNSACSYTFLHSVVCLSVVSHILAPCLNRSTGLDAIWQVHLWGPLTYCVTWRPWPPEGKGRFRVKPLVLCCHLANTNEELAGLDTAILPYAKLLWLLFSFRHVAAPFTCSAASFSRTNSIVGRQSVNSKLQWTNWCFVVLRCCYGGTDENQLYPVWYVTFVFATYEDPRCISV